MQNTLESTLLQAFEYNTRTVRLQFINEEPWWVAKDVCEVLGIDKHRDALTRLDADERGSVLVDTLGGPQEMAVINEAGLYSLILRSRKAEAKAFKRWITHEVIPSIRKTGSYAVAPAIPAQLTLAQALEVALKAEREREALEAKVLADAPKVEFAMQVGSAINAMSVSNAAKVLGTGEIRFYRWLRSKNYLMSGGDHHNRPYQQFIDRGYFRVVETPWKSPSGEQMKSEKTLITGSGLVYLWKKLKVDGEPVCETCPEIQNQEVA